MLTNKEIAEKLSNEYDCLQVKNFIEEVNWYERILGKEDLTLDYWFDKDGKTNLFNGIDNVLLNTLFEIYCPITADEKDRRIGEMHKKIGFDKVFDKYLEKQEKIEENQHYFKEKFKPIHNDMVEIYYLMDILEVFKVLDVYLESKKLSTLMSGNRVHIYDHTDFSKEVTDDLCRMAREELAKLTPREQINCGNFAIVK